MDDFVFCTDMRWSRRGTVLLCRDVRYGGFLHGLPVGELLPSRFHVPHLLCRRHLQLEYRSYIVFYMQHMPVRQLLPNSLFNPHFLCRRHLQLIYRSYIVLYMHHMPVRQLLPNSLFNSHLLCCRHL